MLRQPFHERTFCGSNTASGFCEAGHHRLISPRRSVRQRDAISGTKSSSWKLLTSVSQRSRTKATWIGCWLYARKASLPAKHIENETAKSLFGLTCRNCSNLSTPGIVARARAADKKSVSAAGAARVVEAEGDGVLDGRCHRRWAGPCRRSVGQTAMVTAHAHSPGRSNREPRQHRWTRRERGRARPNG